MYLLSNNLPNTGEAIKNYGPYLGGLIIVGIIIFLIYRKKKDDK